MFDIASSTSASDINLFRVVSNVGGTGNIKFRVDSDGDVFSDGGTAMGTPADVAENYPVLESGIEAGDVVSVSTSTVISVNSETLATTTLSGLIKATRSRSVIGVVSTKPGVLLSAFTASSAPVALAGRVPVKISSENGGIMAGDSLTVSKLYPGYAAKANYSGDVIGYALQPFAAASTTIATGIIEVFVKVGWQNVNNSFVLGENDGQLVSGTSSLVSGISQLATAFLINQKGSNYK
jgi:X-X-X-Leu-X-X-Gly heptad repeat protein